LRNLRPSPPGRTRRGALYDSANWPGFTPPHWPAFTPPLTATGRSRGIFNNIGEKQNISGNPNLDPTSFGFSSSQANGGNFVDQNGDAEEAAPRVDAAHHLVEGPDDQTAGGDHLGHCRYDTVRMREPEDRRRDEKDAEREVWCLSNGDRSRLAVAETPEQKSSHHRACPIQIRISRSSRHGSFAKLVASRNEINLGLIKLRRQTAKRCRCAGLPCRRRESAAAVSAEGSTIWVLIRRLNSSCRRSIAFDVRIDFHWLFGDPIWCVRRAWAKEMA